MYILEADVARYRNLRLWAENGLVHWEDARNNAYDSMPVRSCLHRINALSEMLGNTRESRKGAMDEAFRIELQGFIEAAAQVCQKAREQGEASDASMVRDRIRRLPKTVCMPSALGTF